MRGLQGLGLVAGRELREAVRRKSFWIIAGLLLVGSSAAMIVPDLLEDDSRDRFTVVVVDGTPTLESLLVALGVGLEADIELTGAPDRAAAATSVRDDEADVAVIAGADPAVVVLAGGDDRLVAGAQQALATVGLADRLEALGVAAPDVDAALSAPAAPVERLDTASSERRAASAIVAILLYILLLTLVMQVANGTAIEKANRISEVLLAIVRPGALLFGKVLGVGLVGLFTLACGLLPVAVNAIRGGDLPTGLLGALVGGGAWFVLGIALYLTLAGALGALVERQEEAGSVVLPLTLTLIGTYLVAQSAPDSPFATVLAYVPLTSPLVMPARLAMGVASPVEVVCSLVILLVSVIFAMRFGAVVYRRAIVRTGRRLKLRQVLRGA